MPGLRKVVPPGARPLPALRRRSRAALWYTGSMRVKTSVTLSAEALKAIDRHGGKRLGRSRIIEQAVLEFAARRDRARRDARELELLNTAAEELDREVADVLRYQVDL